MSSFIFDASTVSPQTARAAWPKGKYRIAITQSEIKDKNGNKQLSYGAKALEKLGGGEVPASLLLQNLNIQHSNSEAQRIALSELSSVCHAIGVMKLTATENLHGHEFVVDVEQRFEQDKNEDGSLKVENGLPVGKTYNDIKGYYKKDGSAITANVVQAQAQVSTAPPPWAGAMATTPVAPATLAQLPIPIQAAPVPPIVSIPASVPETLYYVSHKGAAPTGAPLTKAQVLALGHPPAEYQVNVMGTQDWVKGVDFVPVQQAQSAADVHPWMKPQA